MDVLWGAVVLRYTTAAGAALVIYDWLLTLNDEVCVHVLEHMPLHSPYALFSDDPCLARRLFLANCPLLH